MKYLICGWLLASLTAFSAAQECTERFDPFAVTRSSQTVLRPGDQVWFEYSTDCFHIPNSFCSFDESLQATWGGQEDYSRDEFDRGWRVFGHQPSSGRCYPRSVLGDDGNTLPLDSFEMELENGRVRSIATIPSLIGRPTVEGGPIVAGDELYVNWVLDLSMPLGNTLSATIPESRLQVMPFTVAVPEPHSHGSPWLSWALCCA